MKLQSWDDVTPGSHIHLMGICGTAMASLAGLLKERGFRVTGSDQNVYPPMSTQLEELGIAIMEGYRAENLTPAPDLVIVGNVITARHDEAVALVASDIPYTSLPEAMGQFVIADRESFVLAGTHGKTTTTAMLAWVTEQLGLQPGFLVGGIPCNFPRSFQAPRGNIFVIEGDEYDTAFFDKVPKFVHYRPRKVLLTSLEFDHADIYRDLAQIQGEFRKLLGLIPGDGRLVHFAEEPGITAILDSHTRGDRLSYGWSEGDFQVGEVTVTDGVCRFDVLDGAGQKIDQVELAQFGRHNILNALGVYALCRAEGWDLAVVKAALASFRGVKRRQEIIGEPGGVTVVEDFAHHPTAVKLTIESMAQRFPERRLFVVFEPRSATTRRNIFEDDYVDALAGRHEVLLAPPFDQSRIPEQERFSSVRVASSLEQGGTTARSFTAGEGVPAMVDHLVALARPDDVILIMSNGGFDGIYEKLLAGLADKLEG
jgi:UDP-N-acetylmuramate: L-alanyl-gamma-D-glutamyl-meso-diaminopimelate ligase